MEVKDVDAAIGKQNEAVDLTPLDAADRPGRLSNLAISYVHRFERFSNVRDIDASILYQKEAVKLTPVKDISRPQRLSNLGGSLLRRFERFGEVDDIDGAIAQQNEALALTPKGNADRPTMLNNLGVLLMRRFERFGEVKDIDAAIAQETQAVDLTPPDSAHRPRWLNSLGISLRCRFERFEDVQDIGMAIEREIEAVDLTPLDSADRPRRLASLGSSLLCRFKRNGDSKDRQKAIDAFRSSSLSHNGDPVHRMQASLLYARLTHRKGDLTLASEAYTQAVDLLPETVWIGMDAVSQLNQLTSDFQSFGSNAAACLFSRAQSDPDHEQQYLGRALELLDQTRSILWSQASSLRQNLKDLRKKDKNLAEELDRIGRAIGQSCFRDSTSILSEAEEQHYRRSAEKWKELVLSARKLPGFEHFLLPLPIAELQMTAKSGPVVIINVSEYRSDALIVQPNSNLILLPLSSQATESVTILAKQWHRILRSGRSRYSEREEEEVTESGNQSLHEVLNQTWVHFGEPITQKLEELGLLHSESSEACRVWWCLTGEAAFLPIHASLPPLDQNGSQPAGMIDITVSSYTPTLSMLLRSQRQKALPLSMLAIGQPDYKGLPALPCVKAEIEAIRQLLPDAAFLEGPAASVEAVTATLSKFTWVHFACHGIQNDEKPLDSGLMLYNNLLLKLSRIAQTSLDGGEFAFLSSCQTATGSKLLPNESVHLAAGVQFLGFRSVIGTMWSVKDNDALYVARKFYQHIFRCGTSRATASDAAASLRLAVLSLRDEQKVPLAQWLPFIHFGC